MGGKILEHEAKMIREEGIRGTVSVLKCLGFSPQDILDEIQKQLKLTPEISRITGAKGISFLFKRHWDIWENEPACS